jgi:uncharacterized membrane protein YGL010W
MGRFEWVRRMGVHEAYHLDRTNRLIHWICIPIELMMIVKLLSMVHFGPLELAVVVIWAVGVVYLFTEVLGGALMIALLFALRWLAVPLTTGRGWLDIALALAIFVIAFVIQTQVGHNVFEEGVDDTEMNISELARTKNPVPILLVFYYHVVELLFALGYRPSLRKQMEQYRDEQLQRITNDPRRRASASA